jgi:electron-transferring-flavoprotein dehydrogenase
MMPRDTMEYDVVIVGAGPAGLSAAIRLAQLANQTQKTFRICVLEKAAEIGAHSLSGAVFEPRALHELIPDWQNKNAPLQTFALHDEFLLLTQTKSFKLPTPPQMQNKGNFIISLGLLCKWLAKEAENLGVEIFSGFAATEILYNEKNEVIGVATGDVGIDKNGQKKTSYQPGIALHAKYTLLAEGARGSLTKTLCKKYHLQDASNPQTYGIGIKEIWEIPKEKHKLGTITHTVGWPLQADTYGGSFIYHLDHNKISIGFVVGLDYANPYLDPYQEFQRFKQHPAIRSLLEGGQRIAYGARALNEGGLQSIPKLVFPGGLLIGCAAGFLNVPKIKGNHTAMKSGMLAAETIFQEFTKKHPRHDRCLNHYETAIRDSWIWTELYKARNIRAVFRGKYGLWKGLIYAALDTYLFRGKAPWTFRHHQADHLALKKAAQCKPIHYPKPDGKISFDKLTSLQFSNTYHEADQPVHLQLQDNTMPIKTNLALYDAPEQRYCPAGVYEIIKAPDNKPYLQINAQNCLHCKTCDIKDPMQNINWVPPEGGGGPNYSEM